MNRYCGKILIVLMLVITASMQPVYGCYVIAAGKDATADGSVIFGHVEQNYTACVLNFRYIPRREFGLHDTLTLKRGGKLAQVPEVHALIWTQNIKQEFADGFMNEWGVSVYTNQCTARETSPQLTDGGIGYFFRRLVAERAKTSREGVHVAGEFVEKFGYAAPTGRTLTIADQDEIWLFALCKGKHWVARKVPDDHAIAMPNTYIIREIDLQDTMNCLSSPDLIQYAQNKGWYTSGTFIFTDVYGVGYTGSEYDRQWNGQKALTDNVVPHGSTMPFSVKPDKKLTVKDVLEILRDNDNYATQEIAISQLRSSMPREIGCIFWRTTAQGKYSVLTPWYAGITGTPDYYCKKVSIDEQLTLQYNFAPPAGTFNPDPDLVWWEYKGLQDKVQSIALGQTRVIKVWSDFEQRCYANQSAIEQYAVTLFPTNQDSAKSFVTEYAAHVALKAKTVAEKMNASWITSANSSYCVALASAAPLEGRQPLPVSFDGFGCTNGTITGCTWDFGDGTSGTGSSVTHTYNDTGTFYAVLSVEDNQGQTDNDSILIVVKPGIVSVLHQVKSPEPEENLPRISIGYPNTSSNTIVIYYHLGSEPLQGTIRIQNLTGRVLKLIPVCHTDEHRMGSIRWNGCTASGKRVPAGVYICNLVVNGRTYGSEKFVWR